MNSTTIRTVLIVGTITLISVLGIQVYSLYKAWELKDEHFDQRVRVALHNVAERIAEYNNGTLPPKNLIYRKTSNYYLVNINDVIDAGALEHFLYDELSNVSLNLDFEYAVFDCFSKEMMYGNYCKVQESGGAHKIVKLPTSDEFLYYFGVRFPTKTSFILAGSTRYWLGALVLLFTIGFFIYATYVILLQKKISEMQSDFINNMTHEFKTPISSIRISSEVLGNSPEIKGNKRLTQYVNIIKDQENRLNTQIERILNIARIERDNMELNREELQLNDIVKDVARSRLPEIEKVDGKVETDFTGGIIISADQVHLSNIIHTLLDNAIKYSGRKIDILLKTAYLNDKAVFLIKDKGIGMSSEQLSRIGQKFYRVAQGNVHDVKGFGLGLYYVKQICSQHGWRFEIQGGLNKGTTVRIIFND